MMERMALIRRRNKGKVQRRRNSWNDDDGEEDS